MVSLAACVYSSAEKRANFVTVQLITYKPPATIRTSQAVLALFEIYRHMISTGAQGRAVVSISFGLTSPLSWFVIH